MYAHPSLCYMTVKKIYFIKNYTKKLCNALITLTGGLHSHSTKVIILWQNHKMVDIDETP